MQNSFKVFVVDDDPMVLELIRTILEPDCRLFTFQNAEECDTLLKTEKPDLFMLDVNLPGMDGYTFCRQIKDNDATHNTPVIFISGKDTIEERVLGYDAGAEDFIVKPFEPEELLRKFKVSQSMILNQRSLAEQIEEAELLSSLVIANMDETGILLQFMSKLISMESQDEVTSGLLELMQRYRLDGVVQTRCGNKTRTLSAAGENLPLEVSIIEHVRDQGRIFEFHRRCAHNFERVTLMVNNLPIDDPEFCGRLRDHLSVAAQGTDARLKALQTEESSRRAQNGILEALESVSNMIMELHDAHRRNTADSSMLISELQATLLDSFYKLGLTDNQEKFLQNMVGDFITQMADLLTRGTAASETLQKLSVKLGQLRNC